MLYEVITDKYLGALCRALCRNTLMTDQPRIDRQRHETRRRTLTVQAREQITPNMLRLTLGGPELEGFVSAAPDDHIKVFAPDETGATVMRDYTPRRYDPSYNFV